MTIEFNQTRWIIKIIFKKKVLKKWRIEKMKCEGDTKGFFSPPVFVFNHESVK